MPAREIEGHSEHDLWDIAQDKYTQSREEQLQFWKEQLAGYLDPDWADLRHAHRKDIAQAESKIRILEDEDLFNRLGQKPKGYLYEADIDDAAITDFVNLDAPMSEQSELVRRVARNLGIWSSQTKWKTYNGGDFYRALVERMGGDDAMASHVLSEAGIKGSRFLDAASRRRRKGNKTYNYVVFDDSVVKTLKRNDQPIGE